MKRVLSVLALCVCLPAGVLRAQTLHDDIALTRQEIQTERQAIVAANMELTEDQSATFWPLYRAYRQDIDTLGDRMVKLLEDYAAHHATLTDEQASTMLDEMFSIQSDEIKIMSKHAKKMRTVLPAKTVARFFQIENQLNHILRAQLADEVPLVGAK